MNVESMQTDWRAQYMELYYGQGRENRDPWYHWVELLRRHVPSGAKVLEVGGGPVDATTQVLRERASDVAGLDVDPVVKTNPLLSRAMVYDGGAFPLPDRAFDVVVSRWVNEHVPNPVMHFQEVNRVLAPGGIYIFRTVNFYHYSALVAGFTPHWVHVQLVRHLKRNTWEDHYDAYRTFYRANTRRKIRKICAEAGLTPEVLKVSEFCSGYGMNSRLLFRLFMCYERLMNSSRCFEGLRHTIDCVARKPAATGK